MWPQFVKRVRINSPLEVNNFIDRPPEIHPTPAIEFRMVTTIETNFFVRTQQTQHEPALFLTNAQRLAVATNVLAWQTIF